jgi:hypothetical protein
VFLPRYPPVTDNVNKKDSTMIRTLLGATILSATAFAASAATYTVTVTNDLGMELVAPILIANVTNDGHIFAGDYVTPEAEEQILTGDPAKLAARIGADAMVGHGMDGPPGVLLAPGKSVSFDINTDADMVRVLAMIAPTHTPDNYVTAVIDLEDKMSTGGHLVRYDIGHDEMTKMTTKVMMGDAMMEDGATATDTMASEDGTMATEDPMASEDAMASDDSSMEHDTMADGGVTISFVLK